MLIRVLTSLYVFLITVTMATAQGQTYAVVVGISDYQALSARTGDLRFADRDARQVAAFLRSKTGGSMLAPHLRLLTNKQASGSAIREALLLFRKARAGDRVILYFSGHGAVNSFVPYDARVNDERRLLTYSQIKAAFRESDASVKLCIADACLSGSMAQRQLSERKLAKAMADRTGTTSQVAMLLASRSTENAVENGRLAGGAFTYFLLRGLGGQADRNADRTVTIRELHQYVMPRVKQSTRGRQTPVFYGRFSDTLALAYL